MLVNPKLKDMQCFKRMHCLRGKDLFARVGERSITPLPSSEDVIPLNQRKLDMIEDLSAYDRQLEFEHAKKMQEEYARKLKEESERTSQNTEP